MKEPKYCFMMYTDFSSRKIMSITESILAVSLQEDFEYTTDIESDRIIILYDNLNACKRDRNRVINSDEDVYKVLSQIHEVKVEDNNLYVLEEI